MIDFNFQGWNSPSKLNTFRTIWMQWSTLEVAELYPPINKVHLAVTPSFISLNVEFGGLFFSCTMTACSEATLRRVGIAFLPSSKVCLRVCFSTEQTHPPVIKTQNRSLGERRDHHKTSLQIVIHDFSLFTPT